MSKYKLLHTVLWIVLLTAVLLPASVLAANGDGTGGGSGANKNIPLTLVKSSVSDGASDVAVNETIQLDFNKNVCNVTMLADNKKCFHLTDASGEAVAIKLIFPDDQLQHDYKKQVFIIPQEDLDSNTSYKVAVDSTLRAKNGTTIDNAHTFTFTTGTERTDAENKVLKKLNDNIVIYETAYGETADSVPVDKSGLDDVSEEQGPDTGTIARIAAIVLILVVIAFTAVFLILRRRRE